MYQILILSMTLEHMSIGCMHIENAREVVWTGIIWVGLKNTSATHHTTAVACFYCWLLSTCNNVSVLVKIMVFSCIFLFVLEHKEVTTYYYNYNSVVSGLMSLPLGHWSIIPLILPNRCVITTKACMHILMYLHFNIHVIRITHFYVPSQTTPQLFRKRRCPVSYF